MRASVAGLGLGEVRGDHAVVNPAAGVVAQVLRGILLVLWLALLVATVVDPSSVDGNAAVMTGVVAAVYAVTFGWRRLTARLGVNRCYLCEGGVAVTDRFGRVRDSVAWREVTGVRQEAVVGLVAGFHRVEVLRGRCAPPLWLVVPGARSRLARALVDEGRRAGVLE